MVNALIVIQLLNGQQPAQLLEPCTCELTVLPDEESTKMLMHVEPGGHIHLARECL